MRIVFQRRRAEQQDVTALRSNWRDGAPAGFARMAGWSPQVLRFVYDQQVNAGADGLLGEMRTGHQHLERDHRAAMQLERVEVLAEIPGDVAQPLGVK